MKKRPKIRKLLERWTKEFSKRAPHYIDEGLVFMVPPSAPADGFYLVVWFQYHYGRPEQWVCTCPSWRYSDNDTCKHVRLIKEQVDDAFAAGLADRTIEKSTVSARG